MNPALSPEEASILESIRKNDGEKRYPLFINGRAGSGKSLILQYLFSDVLKQYACIVGWGNGDDENQDVTSIAVPVYFACNNKLLDSARDNVKRLLLGRKQTARNVLEISDDASYYLNFHSFLKQLLPDNQKIHFKPENEIDFPRFKKLWNTEWKRRRISKCSAEKAWSVIRNYIKGAKQDGYLTPSDYSANIAKISLSDYNRIYDFFNDNYKDNYWDIQDVIQLLLETGIEPRFSAVFCDEAQDLTQNEIDILYKLSIYSRKVLDQSNVRNVPFSFAGDPFQTLNPTGFSWQDVSCSFYKNMHDLYGEGVLAKGNPLNMQNLKNNYRAHSRDIVKISNSVQAIRLHLFGKKYELQKPQESWWIEEGDAGSVKILPSNMDSLWEDIDGHELIIMPTPEDGEFETVIKKDEDLKGRISEKTHTISTSVAVKGLEEANVNVCNFGCSDLAKKIVKACKGETSLSEEDCAQAEFYLNELYVAITRPTRNLKIIDKNIDDDYNFWNYVKKLPSIASEVFNDNFPTDDKSYWINSIYVPNDETARLGNHKRESDDELIEKAKNRFKSAIAEQDVKYFNDAKLCYVELVEKRGHEKFRRNVSKAEGWIAFLENRYEDAIDCFKEAQDKWGLSRSYFFTLNKDALKQELGHLHELHGNELNHENELKYRKLCLDFIDISGQNSIQIVHVQNFWQNYQNSVALEEFNKDIKDPDRFAFWKKRLVMKLDRLGEISEVDYHNLIKPLILNFDTDIPNKIKGRFAYYGKEYALCLQYFKDENLGDFERKLKDSARMNLVLENSEYPQSLIELHKVDSYAEVIKQYEDHKFNIARGNRDYDSLFGIYDSVADAYCKEIGNKKVLSTSLENHLCKYFTKKSWDFARDKLLFKNEQKRNLLDSISGVYYEYGRAKLYGGDAGNYEVYFRDALHKWLETEIQSYLNMIEKDKPHKLTEKAKLILYFLKNVRAENSLKFLSHISGSYIRSFPEEYESYMKDVGQAIFITNKYTDILSYNEFLTEYYRKKSKLEEMKESSAAIVYSYAGLKKYCLEQNKKNDAQSWNKKYQDAVELYRVSESDITYSNAVSGIDYLQMVQEAVNTVFAIEDPIDNENPAPKQSALTTVAKWSQSNIMPEKNVLEALHLAGVDCTRFEPIPEEKILDALKKKTINRNPFEKTETKSSPAFAERKSKNMDAKTEVSTTEKNINTVSSKVGEWLVSHEESDNVSLTFMGCDLLTAYIEDGSVQWDPRKIKKADVEKYKLSRKDDNDKFEFKTMNGTCFVSAVEQKVVFEWTDGTLLYIVLHEVN